MPTRRRKARSGRAATGDRRGSRVPGRRGSRSSGSTKFAVSFARDLAVDVQRAAARGTRGNVSAWLAKAAADRLRHEALEDAVRGYEARRGAITDEEVAEMEERLWPSGG